MCLCLKPHVSFFNSIFFAPLMIILQLDHMHVNYDSNNKHTPPPIPTFGWTGGLKMHLHLKLQVCIFFLISLILLIIVTQTTCYVYHDNTRDEKRPKRLV